MESVEELAKEATCNDVLLLLLATKELRCDRAVGANASRVDAVNNTNNNTFWGMLVITVGLQANWLYYSTVEWVVGSVIRRLVCQ